MKAKIFEIQYVDPLILPNNRWAVYVYISLVGEHEKNVHSDEISALVCSPEYSQSPDEYPTDSKTIVLEYLNPSVMRDRLTGILYRVNQDEADSWPQFYERLQKYFDIG